MYSWMALEPCVFSSTQDLPDLFFTGYGFEGPDFIWGQPGLEAFEKANETHFSGRDDGCYLFLRRDGLRNHTLTTDPIGMCKLFVYRNRRNWAVSNSFARLMDYVIEQGWRITPDYGALDAWTIPDKSFAAARHNANAVSEITLLKSSDFIELTADNLTIRTRPKESRPSLDFDQALDRFLSIWLGRILGLARSHEVSLSAEITGGLDSRTVLAFLLHLRARGVLKTLDGVNIFCSKSSPSDHEVAASLGQSFGFSIGTHSLQRGISLTVAQRVAAWRDYSLGMYAAPYLPAATTMPDNITLGGHGGERLRAPSIWPSLPQILKEHAHLFRRFSRYRALQSKYETHLLASAFKQPDFEDFRQNWGRFHHAHLAQYNMRTPPLMGVSLEHCLSTMTPEQTENGLLLYAIMHRLFPGLATHRFDVPSKKITPQQARRLGPLFDGQITPGKVFCSRKTLLQQPEQQEDTDVLAGLADFYLAQIKHTLREGLRPCVQRDASTVIADIKETQKLPDRRLFQPVHATLLAALIAKGRVNRWIKFQEYTLLTIKSLRNRLRR